MPESIKTNDRAVDPGSGAFYWVDTATERYRFTLTVEDPATQEFGITVTPDASGFFDWMQRTVQHYALRGYTLKHQVIVPAAHLREESVHNFDVGTGFDVHGGVAVHQDERGPYGYGWGYGWGYGYASASHIPREAALIFERTEIVSQTEYQRRLKLVQAYDHTEGEIQRLRKLINDLNQHISQCESRISEIREAAAAQDLEPYPAAPVKPEVKRLGKFFSEVYVVQGEEETEYKKHGAAEARAEKRFEELWAAYEQEYARVDSVNAEIGKHRGDGGTGEIQEVRDDIAKSRETIEKHESAVAKLSDELHQLTKEIEAFRSLPNEDSAGRQE